jgi:dihydroorotate dehydrogenase (NAD+) catalytic subunit
MNEINLKVRIGNLEFKNPVLVASGTFGYGLESKDFIDINKLGGIVTKSLSLKPRIGNPPQRIVETPSGMLNAIGLANIGVEKFIEEKLPELRKFDTKIIVNIAVNTIDEYVECVKILDKEDIDAFEINVSCPNVKEGGLEFGRDLKKVGKITSKVVAQTDKPVIIKLTPNVTSISEFAKVAKDEGATAVSAINTFVGMAVNVYTRKPRLSHITGGLSGPAIRPLALARVFEIVQKVDIPVIGIGGITNFEDALEFLIVGAMAIQVGTHNFVDPSSPIKIVDGIKDYLKKFYFDDINQIIGSLELGR